MRKYLLIVAACLIACVTQKAAAYEYTFDLQQMGQDVYQPASIQGNGITIYIHTDGDRAPKMHAWKDGEGNLTPADYPGVTMTDHVVVNVNGNPNEKKSYYRMHFDTNELSFLVNFNGDADKCTNTYLVGEGSYFFDYHGIAGKAMEQDYEYYTESASSSSSNVILHVSVKDSNLTPTVYYWSQYYAAPWNESWSHRSFTGTETINGTTWYTIEIPWGDIQGGGAILDVNGNYQSANIEGLTPGDHYFYYYPEGSDKRYEEIGMAVGGKTNNYEVWTYHPPFKVNQNEVTFTATGDHGSVDFTLVCATVDDVDRVTFKNGELCCPANTSLRVASKDGYNLREVWLGKPQQGNKSYYVRVEGNNDFKEATKDDVHDMDALWNGVTEDHLYLLYGSKTLSTEPVGSWGSDFYISGLVRIYTEGISLEDLTYSDHNVKEQNHAFDHDLVGYQVVEFAGEGKALLARSVNPISAAHKRVNNGQQLWYNEDGSLEAYANPATDQYAWIALFFEDGVDPAQYVKKQIKNVRGMYCNPKTGKAADFHIHWCNPVMAVDAASLQLASDADVETEINTYCPANLSDQKGNKYFMIEPRPFEPCNLVDVMRMGTANIGGADGDGVFTPTNEALLPNGVSNKYTINGVEGGGALLGPSNNLGDHKHIWNEVDAYYGADWKTFGKVFTVTKAIIVISDKGTGELEEKGYTFPLSIPNRENEKEIENSTLHFSVFGTAQSEVKLEEYPDEDLAVAESEFYSRYDFDNNQNVYKNDLLVMLNNVDPEHSHADDPFAGIENLEVYRYDQTNTVQLATVATLSHEGNGQFKVTYNSESQNGRGNERLIKDGQYLGDQHFLDESTTYDLQSAQPYIYLSDIFVGDKMENANVANTAKTSYIYRLKNVPKNSGTNPDDIREVTCVIKRIPAFIPFEYSLTRASYSETDVENDENGTLDEKKDFVEALFDVVRDYQVDGWSVMRDTENNFMANVNENRIDHTTIEQARISLLEDENKSNPEQSNYVPVLKTDYNNNTYGCFKQTVNDAEVGVSTSDLEATIADFDGEKYFRVNLLVSGDIIKDYDKIFTSQDKHYLYRIWRIENKGKENEKVTLLNTAPEMNILDHIKPADANTNEAYENWISTFELIDGAAQSQIPSYFVIKDVFKAPVKTSVSSIAPKAANDIVIVQDVDYKVALYVQDENTGKFYVRTVEVPVEWSTEVVTGINAISTDAQVESVTYYNVAGIESSKPFDGVNIVVTRYTNGATTTSKMVK